MMSATLPHFRLDPLPPALSIFPLREGEMDYRFLENCETCSKSITECRWNPDGSYLAFASEDKFVKIGQLSRSSGSLKVVHNIKQQEKVYSIAWNPIDRNRFALAGDDKQIEIWDVRARSPTSKMPSLSKNIYSSWSPDGKYLGVGNHSDVLAVFDINSGKIAKKVQFQYQINEFAFTANSDHVIVAAESGGNSTDMGGMEIINWQNEELVPVESIPAHTSICMGLSIDRAYQQVAVGSSDYLVSIWDLQELVCKATVKDVNTGARTISFSGDGKRIAVAGDSPDMYICDTNTGETQCIVDCRGNPEKINWHPDLEIVAIGLGDKSSSRDYLKLLSLDTSFGK